MYRRIQGSHSPLSPLPQLGAYFSPANTKNRLDISNVLSKRSFTPLAHPIFTPEISPIDPLITPSIQYDLNATFTTKNPAAIAHQKALLTPRTPPTIKIHSPIGDTDGSDSDISVYFTPPTSFATIDKVVSDHKSAPK